MWREAGVGSLGDAFIISQITEQGTDVSEKVGGKLGGISRHLPDDRRHAVSSDRIIRWNTIWSLARMLSRQKIKSNKIWLYQITSGASHYMKRYVMVVVVTKKKGGTVVYTRIV
jgi:hypothetical protein